MGNEYQSDDPEVRAAFSNTQTPAAYHSDDPEINEAHARLESAKSSDYNSRVAESYARQTAGSRDPKEAIRENAPKYDNKFTHAIEDIPGSFLHGAGTLGDVVRNVARTVKGESTVPYGSPESYAARLSAPFSHAPDAPEINRDPKDAIRRGLPKLSDQMTGPIGQTVLQDFSAPALDITQAAMTATPFFMKGGGAASEMEPALDTHPQSVGASAASPDLSTASAPLKSAVQNAKGPLNQETLENHLAADRLGIPIAGPQASRDPVAYSDLYNRRADPDVAQIHTSNLNRQTAALTGKIDDIRGDSAPEYAHENDLQLGQRLVESYKNQYVGVKKLEKVAWISAWDQYEKMGVGKSPIDTQTMVANIDQQLAAKGLDYHLSDPLTKTLKGLREGKPMDFALFDNLRTITADEMRNGTGSAKAAAGIFRSNLENAPLTGNAATLKPLFDKARGITKDLHTAVESDPAYSAVADEAESTKGANNKYRPAISSPLADRFVDKYVTGGKRANIETMRKNLAADPEVPKLIEQSALSGLKQASVKNEFKQSSYRNAFDALDKKSDMLFSPDTHQALTDLRRVGEAIQVEPPGGFTSTSRTPLVSSRQEALAAGGGFAAGAAEHLVNKQVPFLGTLGRKGIDLIRSKRLAEEARSSAIEKAHAAWEPGAGLTAPPP